MPEPANTHPDINSGDDVLVEPAPTAAPDDQTETSDAASVSAEPMPDEPPPERGWGVRWSRAIACAVLPGLALLLAAAAGYLKWQDASVRDAQLAGAEAVRAATESTVALLSYKPDTVEKDLAAAQSRLTGTFLGAYTSLTHDVVIPGAKQKQISAVATVPGASSVRANQSHAVVLLFVNQTVIIGQDAPTNSASTVRVALDKIGDRWLISQFDPV
jgi:Mce-associated membrane protein